MTTPEKMSPVMHTTEITQMTMHARYSLLIEPTMTARIVPSPLLYGANRTTADRGPVASGPRWRSLTR
jgi:hypothetical protein